GHEKPPAGGEGSRAHARREASVRYWSTRMTPLRITGPSLVDPPAGGKRPAGALPGSATSSVAGGRPGLAVEPADHVLGRLTPARVELEGVAGAGDHVDGDRRRRA